mmetsp:Transcript_150734/g.465138  ORF Transcript_150734/g.465138 Transcript_150734/m.465138 type:complete len:244 (+) Transcript_150734:516-1247(+)
MTSGFAATVVVNVASGLGVDPPSPALAEELLAWPALSVLAFLPGLLPVAWGTPLPTPIPSVNPPLVRLVPLVPLLAWWPLPTIPLLLLLAVLLSSLPPLTVALLPLLSLTALLLPLPSLTVLLPLPLSPLVVVLTPLTPPMPPRLPMAVAPLAPLLLLTPSSLLLTNLASRWHPMRLWRQHHSSSYGDQVSKPSVPWTLQLKAEELNPGQPRPACLQHQLLCFRDQLTTQVSKPRSQSKLSIG